MSNHNAVIYAGNALGPANISTNSLDITKSGFTTLILGLAHIGRGPGAYEPVAGQQTGDIVFNNPSDGGLIMISNGVYVGPSDWPQQLRGLMDGNITQIGLSIGGGGCLDYETIWSNFVVDGAISSDTVLYQNFAVLKQQFPCISFIDFDCEEFGSSYDMTYNWVEAVIAFGNMLKELGINITFCPYTNPFGWMKALKALYSPSEPTVLWMNLQCYDGGGDNNPTDWARVVSETIPGLDGAAFTVSGLWCCNTSKPYCGSTPAQVEYSFECWVGQMKCTGGFIWNYDDVLANQNSNACNPNYSGSKTSVDYAQAIIQGLSI
ncbi:MAG: hypothetical protein MUC87_15335 [Bacteroidia bacterium]|jgi:hypothetical protein|nr:hypothetical protein [Bacteroidia bacterium]